MKHKIYKISKIPKVGITLIEASAGTGKTFSIIILYLRLLINIGLKKKYIKPLLPNDILLITFNNAAKNEIKNRLYIMLNQLYEACLYKKTKISYIKNILHDIEDFAITKKIIKKTQNNIHIIPIYTFHSFFWSILQECQFFYKKKTPKKIIANMNNIQLQATKDFWRKNIYFFSKDILKIFLKKWPDPYKLFKYIQKWIDNPNFSLKNTNTNYIKIEKKHNKIIKNINKIKILWKKEKNKIKHIIKNLTVNKRIYNKKNLKNWYNKIQLWSLIKTKNYNFPTILKYFNIEKILLSCKKIHNINHDFFYTIYKFYKNYISLDEIFISFILKKTLQLIKIEKNKQNSFDFNDITKFLLKQIKCKSSKIKKYIQKKYPITIIDEFQDIDNIQYEIFYKIYKNSKNNSLILVGDPKQSIYNFRNSNIFHYFKLKKKINHFYTLKKNFRSSINMVKSINILFKNVKKPFFFKQINFHKISHSKNNKKINFSMNNINQPAIKFFLYPNKIATKKEYFQWISQECAKSIALWLSQKKNKKYVITLKNNVSRYIQPNDIAILVKNKYEAKIIKKELKNIGLKSIYTSYKSNIFQSTETIEIMWIIDAIIHPFNEVKFQKILTSKILNKNIYEIYDINKKEEKYFNIIKNIKKYDILWKNFGILTMIEEIIKDLKNSLKISKNINNDINIKNILYLKEILHEKNKCLSNRFLLLIWLKKKILDNKNYEKNINSKKNINNPKNLLQYIKIITIYKSKGLEYPLVWIPFFSNFYKKKDQIFYCRKKNKKFLCFKNKKKNKKIVNQDRLAEDLRLLYVAITRSILHCSIGIAPIIKKKSCKNKKNFFTEFHKTALGYLIQHGKKNNYKKLKKELYIIQKKNIIEICEEKIEKIILKKKYNKKKIKKKKKIRQIISSWKQISFSKLTKNNHKNILKKKKYFFYNNINKKKNSIDIKKNTHNFPKGKEYGKFLHSILKKINFYNIENILKIIKKNNYLNISKKWIKKLFIWIINIINTPLNNKDLSLIKLKKNEYTQEMNFIIPIKKNINFKFFNYIIKKFDKISHNCPDISFKNISGILIGTIDLLLMWNKKYYLIDYKSNWLGPDNTYYNKKKIELEIIKHRYDLQYQIYTIAIHRYLKIHIKNYSYEKNFGGILYIFLRSIEINNKNFYKNGIFFKKPPYLLIKSLNNIFNGKKYNE